MKGEPVVHAVHVRSHGAVHFSHCCDAWVEAWRLLEWAYSQCAGDADELVWAVEWSAGYGPHLTLELMPRAIWYTTCESHYALKRYCQIMAPSASALLPLPPRDAVAPGRRKALS